MNRIKCATFDKDMQDSIPKEIRDKMKADRAKAEKEQKTKTENLHIKRVSTRYCCQKCGSNDIGTSRIGDMLESALVGKCNECNHNFTISTSGDFNGC